MQGRILMHKTSFIQLISQGCAKMCNELQHYELCLAWAEPARGVRPGSRLNCRIL